MFASLTGLSALHALIVWQVQSINVITLFSFPVEVATYFVATLAATFFFIGAVCYAVFRGESLDLPLSQLSKDFVEQLELRSEEIKHSTDESLARFGLRGFQSKEFMMSLQKQIGELENELKENMESHGRVSKKSQRKLVEMERKIDRIQMFQRELPKLEKKMKAIASLEKDLKDIQNTIKKIDTVPTPYLQSTDEISVLEGKLLKPGTIRSLKSGGIKTVEDLLLKSPIEIAMTKTITESEAKNLQSVIQLLMVPGIKHGDAVILMKSGVNSKQELALQNTFSLGARLSKTAELYVQEGKIKENEKPTLEEIASWIKLAKTQ